jgi:hypothetical protein
MSALEVKRKTYAGTEFFSVLPVVLFEVLGNSAVFGAKLTSVELLAESRF